MICYDCHFHLLDSLDYSKDFLNQSNKNVFISSTYNSNQFEKEYTFIKNNNIKNIYMSFGLHPWYCKDYSLEFHEKFITDLILSKKIIAIGECGFDLYNSDLKITENIQIECFNLCLKLANKFNLPLIIHNRKALELIFKFSNDLSKLKALIFHSFSFSYNEALSILKKNINAYFSFGNSIFQSKKAVFCVENLPLERILLETDAPYQKKASNSFTNPLEIESIYAKVSEIRNISMENLSESIENNFSKIFFTE